MKGIRFAAAVVAVGAGWGAASSVRAAILTENFESYATTSLMESTWAPTSGAGTLVNTGNPGKAMQHSGGIANGRTFTGTNPTDANPLVWEFDFYDGGANRLTGSLRDFGGSGVGIQAVLEMGRFNDADNPDDPSRNVSGYAVQTSSIGGPSADNGWIIFTGNPAIQINTWHHFRATVGDTFITFELDKGNDGTVDATRTVTINAPNKVWNFTQFGGPSGASAVGNPSRMDNLIIDVPEPGSLALLGLAGLLAVRRRRA